MELELQAEPESVAQLGTFKPLTALREGRPRTKTVRCVWYDSPDRALLETGRTVTEAHGAWHLERLVPAAATWLPGQPSPLLAQAPNWEALDGVLPEPLAPVAAFEG